MNTQHAAGEVAQQIRVVVDLAVRAVVLRIIEAKAIGADLLIMGSRGRHGLSRMVLGSVAHAVLHHAQCPLLVFH